MMDYSRCFVDLHFKLKFGKLLSPSLFTSTQALSTRNELLLIRPWKDPLLYHSDVFLSLRVESLVARYAESEAEDRRTVLQVM